MSQTQIDSLVVDLQLDTGDFTSKISGVDTLISDLSRSLQSLQTILDKTSDSMSLLAKITASANLSTTVIKQGIVNASTGFDELSSKISLASSDLKAFSDTATAIGNQKIRLSLGSWKADLSGIAGSASDNATAMNAPALGGGRVETLLAQIAKYTMFTANEIKLSNDMMERNTNKVNDAVEENTRKNAPSGGSNRGEIAGLMGYAKVLSALLNNGDAQIRQGAQLAVDSGIQDIPANTLSAWGQLNDLTNAKKDSNASGLFANIRNSQFQAIMNKQNTPFMNLLAREQISAINSDGSWRKPEDLLFTLSEDLQSKYDRNTAYNLAVQGGVDSDFANTLTSVPNLRNRVGGIKSSTAFSNSDASTMKEIQQSKDQLSQTVQSLIREVTGGFGAELQFFTGLNTFFTYFNSQFKDGLLPGIHNVLADVQKKGRGIAADINGMSDNSGAGNSFLRSLASGADSLFDIMSTSDDAQYKGYFSKLLGVDNSPTTNIPKAIGGKQSGVIVPGISPDGVSSNPPPLNNYAQQTQALVISNGQGYNRMDLPGNNANTQQISIANVNINTPSSNPADHASAFKDKMEGYRSISAVASGSQ